MHLKADHIIKSDLFTSVNKILHLHTWERNACQFEPKKHTKLGTQRIHRNNFALLHIYRCLSESGISLIYMNKRRISTPLSYTLLSQSRVTNSAQWISINLLRCTCAKRRKDSCVPVASRVATFPAPPLVTAEKTEKHISTHWSPFPHHSIAPLETQRKPAESGLGKQICASASVPARCAD